MTMLSLNMTVREIALEQPQATRVFEKLKIDYCCGGNKSLLDACVTAGVEVANVERMLQAAAQAAAPVNGSLEFQKATLSELIDHILVKHHVFTKEEMVRLAALTAKVVAAHSENHRELREISVLFDEICADLKPHMFKEEQVLFPYIIEMERSALDGTSKPFAPFGTVNNPVRKMMMEHDTVGELLRQLRVSSSNYLVPADGCISYQTLYQALEAFEQDLHQHIHLENNILFLRAIAMEEGQ